MKKLLFGMLGGALGAVVNILFLTFASSLEWTIYVSTGVTWIVIGILIAFCCMRSGILKGIVVAILVSLPNLVYTVVSSPVGAIFTTIEAVIIGAGVGFTIDKMILLSNSKSS